uniref:Uncharacterized protein n=1 Tax=viral metagenome TaxID=1070528 RepID=A0A6C0J9G9_9ZZZZ|tara:strand:- start:1762 stop:2886 length:1125 start_codon:yes stop_codon:yes gene_type:complete
MVFSNLLNSLTGLLTPKNNKKQQMNNQSINGELMNELSQGMMLLNNRKNKLNKLQKRIGLIENLTGLTEGKQRLQTTSQKELELLQKMEQNYNRQLSEYANSYKSFMDEYQKGVNDVQKCKASCLTNIPTGGSDWSYKRQACQAGCDLKGPYVSKCEDTYKKSRTGDTCTEATKGRCLNGQVNLGQDANVISNELADTTGTSLKVGCCDCGGGGGGPPSTMMRGKKILKCNEIPSAFGYTGSNGSYMTSACITASVDSERGNANLHTNYSQLSAQNEELIKTAQKIFNKIQELSKTDLNIQTKLDDEDFDLKSKLAEYGTVYADIISRKGKKDQTMDGQLEDVRYKEDSQQIQLWIWTGLAILTILFAIQRMRK